MGRWKFLSDWFLLWYSEPLHSQHDFFVALAPLLVVTLITLFVEIVGATTARLEALLQVECLNAVTALVAGKQVDPMPVILLF